jgi:hypothetical protein
METDFPVVTYVSFIEMVNGFLKIIFIPNCSLM